MGGFVWVFPDFGRNARTPPPASASQLQTKSLTPMVPKVVKEEGQHPLPSPETPRYGSKPPPPPVLRSTASLVRGSAFKCSAVVVWSGVVTVPWVWGSEHRAAFSCCEGMCSRAAWCTGLSHNTWLCVKRRCIRCLLSRPCHGVGRAVGRAGA